MPGGVFILEPNMRPRSTLVLLGLAGLAAASLTGCSSTGARSADGGVTGPEGVSGNYILALCDADMTASALVDRQLARRPGWC